METWQPTKAGSVIGSPLTSGGLVQPLRDISPLGACWYWTGLAASRLCKGRTATKTGNIPKSGFITDT